MKLYVPNPQKWAEFFERVSKGQTSLYQSGAGRRPRVISVDQSKSSGGHQIQIKAVLPAEQTTARAKSELKREGINPELAANAFQTIDERQQRGTKRKKSLTKTANNKAKKLANSGKRDIFEIR